MAGRSIPTATSGHDETWKTPRQGVAQEAAILIDGGSREGHAPFVRGRGDAVGRLVQYLRLRSFGAAQAPCPAHRRQGRPQREDRQ